MVRRSPPWPTLALAGHVAGIDHAQTETRSQTSQQGQQLTSSDSTAIYNDCTSTLHLSIEFSNWIWHIRAERNQKMHDMKRRLSRGLRLKAGAE